MKRGAGQDSSEKIQIAILTFAMTAGGFALLALILGLKLNPDARARVKAITDDSVSLVKLLESPDMRALRGQAKLNEGQDASEGLQEIIFNAVKGRGLAQGNIQSARVTDKKGIQVIEQPIVLQPGKLSQILQLIGDLKDAKKTLQIESVDITRDRKAKEDEDSWIATLKVVDYVKVTR